jgi:hypothetical protein
MVTRAGKLNVPHPFKRFGAVKRYAAPVNKSRRAMNGPSLDVILANKALMADEEDVNSAPFRAARSLSDSIESESDPGF